MPDLHNHIGLYAITDARWMPDDTALLQKTEAVLDAGVRLIQYRNKSGDASLLLRQARALARLCHDYGATFVVNDDVELALASGARGVHLGQHDGCLHQARARLGSQAIIGRTCHANHTLAQQAAAEGADYVAFGCCFPSQTKQDAPPASPAFLQTTRDIPLPRVAIGGISPDKVTDLLDCGIHLIAVSAGLFAAKDPGQAAQQYLKALSHSHPIPSTHYTTEVTYDSLVRTV